MTAALFIFGLVLGSFINVVVVRLNEPKKYKAKSIIKDRSRCDSCGKKIEWYDNIPLVSFILLGGKCRYCKKAIHWQHPLVELLVGLAWAFSGTVLTALMATLIIGLFISDLRYMTLPEVFSAPLLVMALMGAYQTQNFGEYAAAGIGAALFFLIVWGITRGKGMGFGDVEYALIMGVILGWPKILVGLMAAFILGGAAGVALLVSGKKKLSGKVAFGPFLIVGTVIGVVWGSELALNYFGFV